MAEKKCSKCKWLRADRCFAPVPAHVQDIFLGPPYVSDKHGLAPYCEVYQEEGDDNHRP